MRREDRIDPPLAFACVAMVAYGLWLRMVDLNFPRGMSWDEHHFVLNARSYLAGVPDLNDHPPLGKLIIAAAIELLGDGSVAWRIAPLLFGCANIALVGLLARWATGERRAFYVGAALAALDGFLIAYSRSALLDGMLACLCLATVWTAVRVRTALGIALASLLLGSACAIKYSAVVFFPILAWAALSLPRPALALPALLLAPPTYVGWFSLGLHLARQRTGVAAVIAETQRLYRHHAGLTDWKHPYLSHWYEWFLPTRPIPMRADPWSEGRVRVLNSIGNPLLWWLVDLAVLVTIAAACVALVLAFRKRELPALLGRLRRIGDTPVKRVLLLAAFAAPLLPWLIAKRDSYMNHYLPAYVFGIVLVATLFDAALRRFRTAAFVALLVVGQVAFFYSPIWGQLPLTRSGVYARLFVQSWRVQPGTP